MYEQEARTEVEAENGAKFLFHDTQGIPRTTQEMKWSMNNNYVIPAFRNGYYDTNMLLKYVDLKLDWYTPSEEAFEIIAFIRVALGKEPENVNSKPHFFFIDCMLGSREVIPYFKVRNLDVRELLGKSTLILSTREFSKALHHKTLIATPEGDKEIGKLNIGDYVFSRTGEMTRIKGKSGLILDNTYKIVLNDGREFKASNDHEHIVWVKDEVNGVEGYREAVLTSQELYIEIKSGIEYYIPRIDKAINYNIKSNVWYIGELKRILNGAINPSVSKLKYEPIITRLEFLRELFRHSGSLSSTGVIEFNTEFLNVAWYVRDIIYSIGGYCKIIKNSTNKYKLEIVSNRYKLFIDGVNSKFLRYLPEYDMFKIEAMELIHSEPSYCISVECPTKSFVMSNGIVTHNSVLVTFFMLYMAWKGELRNFGKVNFGLYVSDKMGPSGNVSLTMSTIETLVQQSEFLSSQFEEVKCTQEYAILVRNPRTPAEVKAYNKAMKQGKKLDEVPLRGERTFTLKGIGSSGGRGPTRLIEYLYTDNGKVMMKDVKVGDYVVTPKGTFSKVIAKSKIFNNDMYKLVYKDGRELYVNESHINVAWSREGNKKYVKHHIVTTDLYKAFKDGQKFYTKYTEPVQYSKKKFILDPYLLGIALGDGYLEYGKGLRIKGLVEDSEWYYEVLKDKYNITKRFSEEISGTKMLKLSVHNINKELKELKIAGVVGKDKFIPEEYFYGSIEQRKALLAGLLDTDGSCTKEKRCNSSSTTFSNISKNLAEGVAELARSLGYRARITFKDRDGNRQRLYTVNIRSFECPFTLPRKVNNWVKPSNKSNSHIFDFLVDIIRVPTEPSQCITLDDEDHEYLTTGYLPTHNSRSKSLQRPQFCHEKGTIVTTDMGTHKVEDYYKCGESRIEKGITVKLRGLTTIENVTREHRYWCAKIGNDDRPKWVEAKDLTDMHVIGTPIKDENFPYLYSWRRVEWIKFNDYESEYIPIQTPSHTYITEFGLSHNCIFDDMVANEKDAHSDVKLEAIESTIEGDVGKSLAPKSFKIFIGTAYAEKDPIYKRVTDGTTLPIVFPKAEQIPKEGTPKEGFISVWEDRFPYHIQRADYARAEEAYKRGNPEPLRLVNQENYCRITSEKDRLIPEEMIRFEPMYDVIANASDYLWRITTDFTTTGGIDSDDSSIDLWAIDWLGTYRLIDLELDKTELEDQYELVYQMAKKAYQWSKKSVEIAIEIDGQQAVHLYALKMYLEKKGFNHYYFAKEIDPQGKGKPYEGIKSKNAGSKLDRLKLILPLFMKGQMIFNSSLQDTPQMIRLLNQIEQVTYTKIIAKHDDGLDGLSQNALIDTYLPPKPLVSSSKQATKQISLMEALIGYNDNNNDDSLDDYYNMNYGW